MEEYGTTTVFEVRTDSRSQKAFVGHAVKQWNGHESFEAKSRHMVTDFKAKPSNFPLMFLPCIHSHSLFLLKSLSTSSWKFSKAWKSSQKLCLFPGSEMKLKFAVKLPQSSKALKVWLNEFRQTELLQYSRLIRTLPDPFCWRSSKNYARVWT